MAWKPKTIAGKILKGATIAGGSILGLAAGLTVGGKVGQTIKLAVNSIRDKRIAKGTTTLIDDRPGPLKRLSDKIDSVKEGAINLVAGTTQEGRDYINSIKERTREEAEKLKAINKAVRAGATPGEARSALGLSSEEVETFEGEKIQSAGVFDFLQNKNVLYVGAAILGLYLLSKKR